VLVLYKVGPSLLVVNKSELFEKFVCVVSCPRNYSIASIEFKLLLDEINKCCSAPLPSFIGGYVAQLNELLSLVENVHRNTLNFIFTLENDGVAVRS
jgi:hypothetical protein